MDDLLDDLDDGGDVDNPAEIIERTKSQAAPGMSVLDDLEDENVDDVATPKAPPPPTTEKKKSRSRIGLISFKIFLILSKVLGVLCFNS